MLDKLKRLLSELHSELIGTDSTNRLSTSWFMVPMTMFSLAVVLYFYIHSTILDRNFDVKIHLDTVAEINTGIDKASDGAGWSERTKLLVSMHRLRAGGDIETSSGTREIEPISSFLTGYRRTTLNSAIDAVSSGNLATARTILDSVQSQLRKAERDQNRWSKYLSILFLIGIVAFTLYMKSRIQKKNYEFEQNQNYLVNKEKTKWMPVKQDLFLIDRKMNLKFHPGSDLNSDFRQLSERIDNKNLTRLVSTLVSSHSAEKTEQYLTESFFKSRAQIKGLKNPLAEIEVPNVGTNTSRYYSLIFRRSAEKSILEPVQGCIEDVTEIVKQRQRNLAYKKTHYFHKEVIFATTRYGTKDMISMLRLFERELKKIALFVKQANPEVLRARYDLVADIPDVMQKRATLLADYGLHSLSQRMSNANQYFDKARRTDFDQQTSQRLLQNLNRSLKVASSLKDYMLRASRADHAPLTTIQTANKSIKKGKGFDLKSQIVKIVHNLKSSKQINIKFAGFNDLELSKREGSELAQLAYLVLRDRLAVMNNDGNEVTEILFELDRTNSSLRLKIADDYQGFKLSQLFPAAKQHAQQMQEDANYLKSLVLHPKFFYSGAPQRSINDLYAAKRRLKPIGGTLVPKAVDGKLNTFEISIPNSFAERKQAAQRLAKNI